MLPATIEEYRNAAPSADRRQGGRRRSGKLRDMPLISVVTVTRNAEKTIERTINSVLQQNRTDVEHIVVDGGSTDSTLAILERFNDQLEYWISEPDRGIFDAMNKGISLARGRFIGILNADDYYLPGALDLVAQKIETIFGGIIYGDYIFVAADAVVQFPVKVNLNLTRGMTLGHPAMFVSFATYDRIGLYNPNFKFSGDLEFALRALKSDVVFNPIAQPLAVFESGGAAERNLVPASIEAARAIRRHSSLIETVPFLLRFAQRLVSRNVLRFVGAIFGRRAYVALKRRYYLRNPGAQATHNG
jgi:glycosyltransferase involved in cell wall biosynthesis